MLKNITRRTWSVLIALVMICTTFCIGQPLTASAAVTASTPSNASGVKFVVPEAIYLKPLYNSYYTSTESTFQWYVNNAMDSSGNITLETGEESEGKLYFLYSNAKDPKLSYEWLNASGQATTGGTITVGGSALAVGYSKSISSSTTVVKITGGTSPKLSETQTGAYIRWTVTYTDKTDYRSKTVQAYTYVYKPYVEPIGTAIKTVNDRGTDHYGDDLSWICGVHDTVEAGDYYPNANTSKGMLAISSSDSSGTAVGKLYAQIGDRFQTSANNESPGNWLNTSASPQYMPDKSFRYVCNDRSGPSTGDVAFRTLCYSARGFMTIDVSRYTNLDQIPNLSVGIMVTDDQKSDSGAAYFISNYTGDEASSDVKEYQKSWSDARTLWNKYNEKNGDIFSDGTPDSQTASETEGVKFNGRWKKAISDTGTSTYLVGTGYVNHQGSDTIWDISELRVKVTRYDKATLREAVKNAISNSVTLQSAFYSTSATAWTNYVDLYKAAGMALTKLDGTFSFTAAGTTYEDPNSLAEALNGAVTTLKNGTGRLSNRTAKQTNVALRKVGDNSYVYAALPSNKQGASATFKTYDTVTFSADTDISGYSFIGLQRATSVPSTTEGSPAEYPTSFTTSDTGASFNGSTVTYVHADTVGCGSGNLYYTYYYVANTYKVTFDANKGSGTMADQTFTYGVAQSLNANAFTRPGYVFEGWAMTANGSKVYNDRDSVSDLTSVADGTVKLYAKWKTETYEIQYLTMGGELSGTGTTSYTILDSVTLPSATKSGYSLTNWRADDSGNWGPLTYTAGSTVNSGKYGNVKFTAVWKSNTYTVSYDANKGEGAAMASQNFVYGVGQTLTPNTFSRSGYTFLGWSELPNATEADYADREYVEDLTDIDGANVTLYAVWSTNVYTIVYSVDGGTIRDTDYTREYTINDQITLPENVEKTGYTFGNWKAAGAVGTWNTTTIYSGTHNAGMYGNVTLQAQWNVVNYMITYEVADGSVVGTKYTTKYDVTTTITLPAARRTGYVFSIWQADGSGNWGEGTYGTGNVSAGRYGNVTLTALWTGVQYYVQFNGNGSTSGVMYNQSFTYGEAGTLNPNQYSRGGYVFLGWSKTASDTNAPIANEGEILNLTSTANATVTLYAIWGKINYEITYNTDGGTITTPGTTQYSITDIIQLPVVERTGYALQGWRPTENVGSWHTWDTFTSATIDAGCYEDVTLTALWQKLSFTITYDAQGGTMSGEYTTVYDVDTQTIVLPTITRTGYNFGGWAADAGWNNMLITDTAPKGILANVKLTAQWTQKTYYIHFDANGGQGSMSNQQMRFDVSQPLTLNAFSRDGYNFGGWAMSENGSAVYWDGDSVINLTQTDNGTVTLYAVWTARTFSLTFDINGASGKPPLKMNNIVMDGDAVNLRNYNVQETTIDDKEYEFMGWAYTLEAAELGIVNYANGASFKLDSSVLELADINWTQSTPIITLYAVWKLKEVEIKLVVADDSTAVIDETSNFICGLKPDMSRSELESQYLNIVGNGELVIEGDYLGTGTVVKLVNKTTREELERYELVIFGDVDGDGLFTPDDVTKLRFMNANMIPRPAEGSAFAMAADVDHDGEAAGPNDYTVLRYAKAGLRDLTQLP